MSEAIITRLDEETEEIGAFINEGFARYGRQNGVALNYDGFCFVARGGDGRIIGAVTGRAYYDEVHIGDLIIAEEHRRKGLGRRLCRAVEETYKGRGYHTVTLTTFGFQAPAFYEKLGFEIEFVRKNDDPKLCKYFMKKAL